MINRWCYVILLSVLTGLMIFCEKDAVYAQQLEQQEEVRLVEQYTTEGKLHFFIRSRRPVEDITFQIGSSKNHEIGWHTLREAEEERRTYILIDNSLSVGRQHEERIRIVLTDLFANASDNEKFMVSVFGETTENLTEYTNMYQPLEDAVMQIEYYNRDTYLTDALYHVVREWNQEALEDDVKPIYKRIIVISDGQETESAQYTREELYLLLSQNAYPIYSIGCITGGNIGALGHMSALSRMTGAASYTVTEDGDLEGIVSCLLSERDVIHATVVPAQEMMTGSTLHSKITLVTDGEKKDLPAEVRLPMSQRAESDSDSDVSTITSLEMTEESPTVVPITMSATVPVTVPVVKALPIIGAVVGTFIVLACGYFVYLWKGKESSFFDDDEFDEDSETTLLKSEEKESGTRLLFQEYNTYEVRLTDQSNPAKFYSFPVNDSVIIGRSAQNCNVVIDYDESVSGRHCELESRNGRFYIRDLRSLNGTRVNGIKVLSETEIFSGNVLRLGQVEMKVGWNTFE